LDQTSRIRGGKGPKKGSGSRRAEQARLANGCWAEHAADLSAARRADHDAIAAAEQQRALGGEHADAACLTDVDDVLVGRIGPCQHVGDGAHVSPSVSRMIWS